MKVKALRNLTGVITAHAGEEIEVNEVQARDLLHQGVVIAVNGNVSEVQNVGQMDEETMAKTAEFFAMQRDMEEKAFSEAIQKDVNQKVEQLQEEKRLMEQEFAKQAEQKVQQQMSQRSNQQNQQYQQTSQQNAQKQSQQQSRQATQGIDPHSL